VKRGEPGGAVGIGERHAGEHLGDVRLRVIIVPVGERPPQRRGERAADGGLARSRRTHQNDDHAVRIP
jgi:hypothetical protein